ncbi:MAG TPA: helix-turn-helix domain-containing protein [Candidatus Cybelea sp.]|jgi:HTH-type transcriptional regulator/antitoxin HigA|nr:helix-turn-helix domain-containing protein [Candidatus Cybelea sp.]
MYIAISVARIYDTGVSEGNDDFRTPGQLIDSLLRERGWSREVLAMVLGTTKANVGHIATGRRRIDAATALALSEVFGIEPDRFLDLQKTYDLGRARLETPPDPKRASRAALFASLPINEMINRGWLRADSAKDFDKVETELARFFGVGNIESLSAHPHAAKKSNVGEQVTAAQRAWVNRVKQIAGEMVVARYSKPATEKALTKLQALLFSAEEARKVPRILSDCGIRFVIVESLRSAKIDGVSLWLRENAPVIGMSLRFDRIDNFWFVLRHELEHVLRGHGKGAFILDDLNEESIGTKQGVTEEERTANDAAAEFCVSRTYIEQFIARKAPLITKRDMLGFANTIRVHPGIVAGQLQRNTGRYDLFRDQLVKVRSIVSPGAAVDGWGDIYPVAV